MRCARVIVVALPMAGLLSACGSSADVKSVSMEQCSSGLQWNGGEHGSPEMRPGDDCIACHEDRSEAPRFLIAGTVFGSVQAETNCFGAPDVTVEILDDEGRTVERTTNRAGNFFIREGAASLTFPIRARVRHEGGTAEQVEPVTHGSCNDCHDGTAGSRAPARVTF